MLTLRQAKKRIERLEAELLHIDNPSGNPYSVGGGAAVAKKDRHRKNIDYDPEIDAMLKQVAKELGVPVSQLYQLGAAELIISIRNETSSVWGLLKKSKSRGYKHNVDIEALKRKLRGED